MLWTRFLYLDIKTIFFEQEDVSCDFSEDQCGWTNDPDNQINWKYSGKSLKCLPALSHFASVGFITENDNISLFRVKERGITTKELLFTKTSLNFISFISLHCSFHTAFSSPCYFPAGGHEMWLDPADVGENYRVGRFRSPVVEVGEGDALCFTMTWKKEDQVDASLSVELYR